MKKEVEVTSARGALHWQRMIEGMQLEYDLVAHNGIVIPYFGKGISFDGICIKDGRVLKLGASETDLASAEKIIDLKGGVLIPGFVDAHTHLLHYGLQITGLDLSRVNSLSETLDRLAAYASVHNTSDWIVGTGLDDSGWSENGLTASDIDSVIEDRPVMLVRVDGHIGYQNSRAMELSHLGNADGRTLEKDVSRVLKLAAPTKDRKIEAIERAQEDLLSRGITSVGDFMNLSQYELMQELRRSGKQKLRITAYIYADELDRVKAMGLMSQPSDAWLKLGGIKVFADGSIGARTAAFFEPYTDDPTGSYGKLFYTDEELERLLTRINDLGMQAVVHAIGDRAVEQVSRCMAKLDNKTYRNRIEHCEFASRDAFHRICDKYITICGQPNFLQWGKRDGLYHKRLGEYYRESNPFRFMALSGIDLCFGSDCMPPGPMFGLSLLSLSENPDQELPFERGLKAYTEMSATAIWRDREIGTLEVGKLADFTVLRNYRPVENNIVMTAVEGKILWEDTETHPSTPSSE